MAAQEVSEADILIIIGTSLNVYPAAGLVHYAQSGTPIYLIDPNPSVGGMLSHVRHLQKGASEGMKELCGLLMGE